MDLDLDLSQDPAALTAALVDIPSVSGDEERLANIIDAALRRLPHLELFRDGNAMVARTTLGRPERVVLAGHIDTVPIADNLPARLEGDLLYGCGGCDMKSGVAVQLRLAASLPEPRRDVTYVFYDGEEVEAERNGLLRLSREFARSCSTATWRCCWSRPARSSRAAARARCGPRSAPPASARTAPGPGMALTLSTRPAPILDVLRNYVARAARGRGAEVPRRAERGLYQRGSGGQRHPGRVRGHREPPLRPGPHGGAGPGLRARRSSRAGT